MDTEKNKKFYVKNLEPLQKGFYKNYNPEYWSYKIHLLKNCHDKFSKVKKFLMEGMDKTTKEKEKEYQKTLRTEMHFLYFQMIEALFEIIFGVSEYDNRKLWLALSFSNDRSTPFYHETYKKIEGLTSTDEIFTGKVKKRISGKKKEISLLRWIFYFHYSIKMREEEWKENLRKIKKMLLIFAKDFSDRDEYNAYKHSLRFYNTPFSRSIGITGGEKAYKMGESKDSIVYLEKKKEANGDLTVKKTSKPFGFERDYNCCYVIYEMIKNIINTRKYSILPSLKGKDVPVFAFHDIDVRKVISSKTGKSSFKM